METTQVLNIHQRLALVMKEVDYLKKEKKVETYMAVTHDQVTAELRPWFLVHGIAINTSLVSGETKDTGGKSSKGTALIRFEGVFDVAFINVDQPSDREVVRVPAHANDFGDKAPGKAVSYATKTAMLKKLMIETGENDESRVTDEGLAVDRIVEIEAAMDKFTDKDELRKFTEGACAEAKEAGDHYAHKRFLKHASARADKIDGKSSNQFMPSEKKADEQKSVPNGVDPDTGEVGEQLAARAEPKKAVEDVKAEQPKPAPKPEKPVAAPAEKIATEGMRKTVQSAMKRTGKSEDAMKSKYGFTLESMPFSKTNECLAWARAEAKSA